ncbi:hypothetical protein BB561_000185 [Smittium simulii]|uniref:Uncharacterized protein n=1 Tax=Smittium simulii TaxID=133385 RepID=A0A2T9Z041_9FUNG|nr:hypothetical protein BB561_000185 [Smittium simulii]
MESIYTGKKPYFNLELIDKMCEPEKSNADLTKKSIKSGASTGESVQLDGLINIQKTDKSGDTKNTIAERYNKNDKSKIYIFIKTHSMETTNYSRWVVIRKDTIGQFIPRKYKLANLTNNEPLKKAQRGLVRKLLGGESKLFLSQLKLRKDTNIPLSMGLETAKFMNGIHVAQALIIDIIKYSPTFSNQCTVSMEALVSRSGVV